MVVVGVRIVGAAPVISIIIHTSLSFTSQVIIGIIHSFIFKHCCSLFCIIFNDNVMMLVVFPSLQ